MRSDNFFLLGGGARLDTNIEPLSGDKLSVSILESHIKRRKCFERFYKLLTVATVRKQTQIQTMVF